MNWKKPLSLALAAALSMSLAAPAFAAEETPAPWYAEAQAYVTEKGLMTGTDKGFEPEAQVTKATVLQTLYNMEGKPGATDTVEPWYADAAAWAKDKGIAEVEEDAVITRGDVKTLLEAYCELKSTHSEGLMKGNEDGDLMLDKTLTRAEFAQLLVRVDGLEPYYVQETVAIETEKRVIPAVVTLPVGEGKFPAVVINHGHGGGKDEGGGFTGVARALADAGIASIRMDFAGCGDSTDSFQNNTMTNMIADSNASLAYLLENYDVDADKLGILGYSMGGRIASEIVGEKDTPYKAVVLLSAANVPVKEMATNLFGSLENYNNLKATAQKDGFAVFTTVYGQVQELSKAWFEDMESGKPMESLAKFEGPVLVLHGDVDEMITDEMNKAILEAYPTAQEIIVPEADHGYGFYSDQPDVTAMVEGSICGFFQANLNGKLGPCSAAAISKYGNVGTDLSMHFLTGAGYEVGDMLTVEITGQEPITLPLGTGYSNVDQGSPLALADTSNNTLALAINRGDFATTYGLGVKGEDKTYAITEGVSVTIAMAEKGGYLDEMEIRELDSKRTNVREDYASDEVFANFRAITVGDIAEGKLYRTSSPVNPELGRNTYADGFLKEAGVKTVVNLADSKEAMEGYEGYAESYYATLNVIPLNMGVDMYSDDAIASLKSAFQFMIANEGPYAFHCTEGKDRAGYFAMVLEALMGASVEEITEDYMLSFENYYHVEKGSEQWSKIAESNIEKDLLKLTGAETAEALAKADLQKAAETYLEKTIGLTAAEVTSLKDALSK